MVDEKDELTVDTKAAMLVVETVVPLVDKMADKTVGAMAVETVVPLVDTKAGWSVGATVVSLAGAMAVETAVQLVDTMVGWSVGEKAVMTVVWMVGSRVVGSDQSLAATLELLVYGLENKWG